MLSEAARDEAGHGLSLFEERAVRILAASVTGNQILNEDFIGRHESQRRGEKGP
jgi:hypothetical protein